MSFHFPQVFPLINDWSVWHNGKHPFLILDIPVMDGQLTPVKIRHPLTSITLPLRLHTTAAPEIWIDQSGFSRREKLYCPDVNVSIEVGQLFSLKTASNIQKKAFAIQNLNQIVKSNNFETFSASKLLSCRQCLAICSGGVCRVSPGRIIAPFCRTKYEVPHQIKPRILKLTIRRG